jgi:hypothetical protein
MNINHLKNFRSIILLMGGINGVVNNKSAYTVSYIVRST